MRNTSLIAALAASTCIVAMATPAHAQQTSFNIPAGSLKGALDAYGRQSGRPIVYKADEVRGVHSSGYRGSASPEQALDAILASTGFAARAGASGSVAIVRLGNADAAVDPQGTPDSDIVVTGSRIAGAAPASPVITITRKDIDRSGYSTAGDVVRNLPQSFAGGQNPETKGAFGTPNTGNYYSMSSANLRGLGSDATLTLVNGRRLAYEGNFLGAVDVSAFPFAIIDRVEVLTDGASSIYGSDAVAGVVNFILKKRFDGAVTTGRIGTSTQGGGTEYQANQLLGKTWKTGGILVDYEYYNQGGIFTAQRDFSALADSPNNLVPSSRKHSVYASANQDIGSAIELSVQGFYTDRHNRSVNTALGTSVQYISHSKQYGVNAGLTGRLGGSWVITADFTKARDNSYVINPFTTLSTGATGVSGPAYATNDVWEGQAGLTGNLFKLPGGNVSVALGGGHRDEKITSFLSNRLVPGRRNIDYGYGELRVPLVSPEQDISGLYKLELSASGRYENYSDFGSQFSPKLGAIYAPVQGLTFRGTWGKSFKAAALTQIYGPRTTFVFPAASLATPNAPAGSIILIPLSVNRNLGPERARTLTLGFDYEPAWTTKAKLSFTYFNIKYDGRIAAAFSTLSGSVLFDPKYVDFVIVNPNAAQIANILNNTDILTNFAGATPIDPAHVFGVIDVRYQNLFSQKIHGFDVTGSKTFTVGDGTIDAFANASWLHIDQKLTRTSPEIVISGTIFQPAKFRLRAGLTWDQNPFSVTVIANHTAGELDNSGVFNPASPTTNAPIASFNTIDLNLTARTGTGHGLTDGLRFTLAVQNLFDQGPPKIAATSNGGYKVGYDSTNASGIGRFISFTVSKQW